MEFKRTIAAVAVAGALTFGGAGVAQAVPQNAVAIGGLVNAAINLDRTVDIDEIRLVNINGDVLSDIDIDIENVRVLTGLTIQVLNDADIDVNDVVDVTIVDNVLVVIVDVL